MKNFEIARILHNIATILEMKNVPFKPQAYHHAAREIELLNEDIEEMYKRGELEDIPGVGESIASKVAEYIKTGKIKHYEKLQKQYKINLDELDAVPTLGPKKIKVLFEELKVKDLKSLERVAKAGKIQELKGFSEKTEQNILKGIEIAKSKPKRYLYAEMVPIADNIVKYFKAKSFVKRIEVAGSYRRKKATVGDLDLLIVSTQPKKVMEAFVSYPDKKDI
ncbi:MAG: DNA polymerase III, partial [Nanoarchaeota archaeon]|nr:DNA polymerase III [Nanoarchaeota archaeon]